MDVKHKCKYVLKVIVTKHETVHYK